MEAPGGPGANIGIYIQLYSDIMDCSYLTAGKTTSEVSEDDVISALRTVRGVVAAEPMDEGLAQSVFEAERSLRRGISGIRVENRGMEEVASSGRMYALFCDSSFSRPDEITMEMVSDSGDVIGHDVPESMRARFLQRDDVVWLSEGFVLFPSRIGMSDARMVMLSSRLRVPGLPDGMDARLFYPSTTSAEMMGSAFGVDDPGLAKIVAGIRSV